MPSAFPATPSLSSGGWGRLQSAEKAVDQLGFQQKTGIEIGWEESVGLVGDEDWAARGRGWTDPGTTPWIPEDMASASIGQSVVQITPCS